MLLESPKILSPEQLKEKMSALRLSQSALSSVIGAHAGELNRYLHFHTKALSTAKLERVARVISECEFLAAIVTPMSLNFYDADALLASLEFLRQYRAENLIKPNNKLLQKITEIENLRAADSTSSAQNDSADGVPCSTNL